MKLWQTVAGTFPTKLEHSGKLRQGPAVTLLENVGGGVPS